jgi:hypothetical protein
VTPSRDNELNTELLDAELPDPRFVDADYLAWLYDRNPDGPAIQASADEDGVRVAHYALVPQTYRNAAGPAPFLFSLNAVTRSTTQRRGYWVKLGNQNFAEAAAQDRRLVIGVPNDKSTPGAVKYLGYRFLGPMPVRVVVPTTLRSGTYVDHAVDDAFLASAEFDAMAADLDQHDAVAWTNSYDAERLRWRLARPHGNYAVHVGPDLVAASTKSAFGPVPVAVILKLFPRGPMAAGERRSPRTAIAAACRYHRAPVAVYAGFNALVPVRGFEPPRRLRPAPLNLVVHSFSDEVPQETFRLDTFEFLDLDAY